MKNGIFAAAFAGASLLVASCGVVKESSFVSDGAKLWSMGQELSLFSKYSVDAQVLDNGESMLVFSPELQGRVLTSCYGGVNEPSLGWFNREAVALRKGDFSKIEIGGEDVFSVGPEGGNTSVFFERGVLWTEDNKKTPAIASLDKWNVVSRSKTRVRMSRSGEISNVLGAKFSVEAEREISLLSRDDVSKILGIELPQNIKIAAFQSMNKITNKGAENWSEKYGMLNIGVGSFFNANKTVNVFVPYRAGDASKLGDVVRENSFDSFSGTASVSSRVVVNDEFIRFKCDGRYMSGIGVSPRRSEGIVVSFDAENEILTLVMYIKPSGNRAYFPASWRDSQAGFDGDAIGVFNNGPIAKNAFQPALFYKISTTSPALNLESGKSQFHLQRVFHFHGSEYDLDTVSYKLTGISVKQMRIK